MEQCGRGGGTVKRGKLQGHRRKPGNGGNVEGQVKSWTKSGTVGGTGEGEDNARNRSQGSIGQKGTGRLA